MYVCMYVYVMLGPAHCPFSDLHFGWQGIHLRVVGVCDSKSLVVASDVFSTEIGDEVLLEVCRVKLDGSSLSTLRGTGFSPCILCCASEGVIACTFVLCVFLLCQGEFQIFVDSEVTKKVVDIAALLGKSTGLFCSLLFISLDRSFCSHYVIKFSILLVYCHAFCCRHLTLFLLFLANRFGFCRLLCQF